MNNIYLEYILPDLNSEIIGLPDGVIIYDSNIDSKFFEIEEKIRKILNDFNYKIVVPPIFEYYETFEKGSGYNIARKTFCFKDKDGKLLSLRYDMTTPIARLVSSRYNDSHLPLKFFYTGDVFREQPLHKGKLRQIRQIGVEYIGNKNIEADIEIVELLGRILNILDNNYKLIIGNILPYKNILSNIKLDEYQIEAIHIAFHRKDITSLRIILDKAKISGNITELLINLCNLYGNIYQINNNVKLFNNYFIQDSIDYTIDIYNKINPEIKSHILFDFGLIKDFSYYTSIILEGYLENAGFAIANGGRYDNLLNSFGKNYPAIGFAIDLGYCII